MFWNGNKCFNVSRLQTSVAPRLCKSPLDPDCLADGEPKVKRSPHFLDLLPPSARKKSILSPKFPSPSSPHSFNKSNRSTAPLTWAVSFSLLWLKIYGTLSSADIYYPNWRHFYDSSPSPLSFPSSSSTDSFQYLPAHHILTSLPPLSLFLYISASF